MSANFAFMLSQNRNALANLLSQLGLVSDHQDVEIGVQVPYEDGSSVVDIEICKEGHFLVFLESKIWGRPLLEEQLSKYARILNEHKEEYKVDVRLVAVTHTHQAFRFQDLRKTIRLFEGEFLYFRWKKLVSLLDESKVGCSNGSLKKMFDSYLGDMMKDKVEIENLKVGELKEVLVQATRPEFWEVNKIHCFCTQKMVDENGKRGRVPANTMFVAFYRTSHSAITHIAKVKEIKEYVPSQDVYGNTPFAEKGWKNLDKVYWFDTPVELKRHVPRDGGHAPPDWRYTTVENLLSADTMADL